MSETYAANAYAPPGTTTETPDTAGVERGGQIVRRDPPDAFSDHSVIGIDPGKTGGVARLYREGSLGAVWSLPVVSGDRPMYDRPACRSILVDNRPELVVIEQLQPMPLKFGGSQANFARGEALELWIAMCAALQIRYWTVRPQKWQALMLTGIPGDDTKQRSIVAAKRLWPRVSLKRTERSRKDDDALSDALLIAEYGRRLFYEGGK